MGRNLRDLGMIQQNAKVLVVFKFHGVQ
jgi:hypothetical protein